MSDDLHNPVCSFCQQEIPCEHYAVAKNSGGEYIAIALTDDAKAAAFLGQALGRSYESANRHGVKQVTATRRRKDGSIRCEVVAVPQFDKAGNELPLKTISAQWYRPDGTKTDEPREAWTAEEIAELEAGGVNIATDFAPISN